ncbi:hypothetical protein [Tenacibaculum maritimum]|uniref:hypothetical protein n=1 Tax=Tenacibaculum maritimum TaxID=107401 RepID=UPI0012E578F2|nr:hypothetical protein [Tenacibaculum maritimum]MCD9581253.1 hypothetical protein [Tenacibaculum maritimum]MCD9635230.1 hypothetical protein [Tenacibaculum maritimum]CAA0260800.1 conserved hypothetical protein [Tenacibaculum maritimum]
MEQLINRVKDVIDVCWDSFSAKVGSGLISINKEASMQLQFAYLLKSTIDLTIYNIDESVSIELETSIPVKGKIRVCDIVLKITKGDITFNLPIELKCYRNISSSSGKLRGAQDLFKYGVYEDLELIENYCNETTLQGIQLTMTDAINFPYPKYKKGKSWDYDISNGTNIINGIEINTPIGGKPKNIKLLKSYIFNWKEVGEFYFIKLEAL